MIHRYRIVVEGRLGPATREMFAPLACRDCADGTELTGPMDQAALAGYLQRALSRRLVLVEVRRLDNEDDADPAISSARDEARLAATADPR